MQEKTEKQNVYMTVLSNELYIPGVKALKRSLIKVKSANDLIILVPRSKENELRELLTKKKILDERCRLCVKDDVVVDYGREITFEGHYWLNTYFKLSAASCTEFNKVVLLDSDMLIEHNLDHLFEMPNYSAVVDCFSRGFDTLKLNSGFMVIEPSEELYRKLLDSVKPAMERCDRKSGLIGDQEIFQEAYLDWGEHTELHLPNIYNCFFNDIRFLAKTDGINVKDIAVIHFIGRLKPWSNRGFNVFNIRYFLVCISHLRFYELKLLIKYILMSY